MLALRKQTSFPTTQITSTLPRSLADLRKRGYHAAKVEMPWNPYSKVRNDLFGFGDIYAFGHGENIICQSTERGNMSSRRKKILNNPIAHEFVKNGGTILLHGWKKPTEKCRFWKLKEEVLVP